MNGWNSSKDHDYELEMDSDNSITLATADVPFLQFIGKTTFSFFSNDTRVLGTKQTMRTAPKISAKRGDSEGRRFINTDPFTVMDGQFPFGEREVSLFNYNYDMNSDMAQQRRIPLLNEWFGDIYCEDCYIYAG